MHSKKKKKIPSKPENLFFFFPRPHHPSLQFSSKWHIHTKDPKELYLSLTSPVYFKSTYRQEPAENSEITLSHKDILQHAF